jgi:thiamine kinase-like enzyme
VSGFFCLTASKIHFCKLIKQKNPVMRISTRLHAWIEPMRQDQPSLTASKVHFCKLDKQKNPVMRSSNRLHAWIEPMRQDLSSLNESKIHFRIIKT